jgi:hypothetical protein
MSRGVDVEGKAFFKNSSFDLESPLFTLIVLSLSLTTVALALSRSFACFDSVLVLIYYVQ